MSSRVATTELSLCQKSNFPYLWSSMVNAFTLPTTCEEQVNNSLSEDRKVVYLLGLHSA